MIRIYLIRDYKKLYPDLSSHVLSDRIVEEILTGEGMEDPVILRTENGKPYDKEGRVNFSLSHTECLFACAVAEYEIGLDIQSRLPKDPKAIVDRFFTDDEKAFYEKAAGADGSSVSADAAFLNIWTKKEALIKYRGATMKDVISSCSVLEREDVRFIELQIDAGTVGCLCIPPDEEAGYRIVRS